MPGICLPLSAGPLPGLLFFYCTPAPVPVSGSDLLDYKRRRAGTDLLGLELTGAFGATGLTRYTSVKNFQQKRKKKDSGEQICYYLKRKRNYKFVIETLSVNNGTVN